MTKTTIERELELIDGMIEVQLHHAEQCDRIANRTMAEKQKAWDMERVALLRKMRAALAAQPAEPVAMLYDDGTWIAERTTAGRALNNRMLFAGSPKVGVYVAPPAQPADSITPSNKE